MKHFKLEENILGLLFGVLGVVFHYFFVVQYIYFPPVRNLPSDFGIYPFDSPLLVVYNLFIKTPSQEFYKAYFAIFGSLVYMTIGAFFGAFFDRFLKKIRENEEKAREEEHR